MRIAARGLSLGKPRSGALARLLEVHIGAQPVVRGGRVALAGGVFGEKDIAGIESDAAAVADADIDAAGEGNHPTAVRGSVVVYDMRREIVPEEQAMGIASDIKKVRG